MRFWYLLVDLLKLSDGNPRHFHIYGSALTSFPLGGGGGGDRAVLVVQRLAGFLFPPDLPFAFVFTAL